LEISVGGNYRKKCGLCLFLLNVFPFLGVDSTGLESFVNEITLEKPQLVGFVGTACVILGTLAPLVHLPIVGSVSYVLNGRGDGMIVLALALLAGVLTFLRQYFWLRWATGAIALLCLYTFIKFQSAVSDIQEKMNADLEGNPFKGLAQAMAETIGLGWGWAFLLIGVGSLAIASALGAKSRAS
jgi:hypothetical protein